MSAGGAAAAAAATQAARANGVVVHVGPEAFERIVARQSAPLVVRAPVRFLAWEFGTRYLTSYKGLAFTTRTKELVRFPADTEFIDAKQIGTP